MTTIKTLRLAILGEYKSIAAFAKAVGWSNSKASRIVRGEQAPDLTDIRRIAKALHIETAGELDELFCLVECPQTGNLTANNSQ